MAEFGYDIAVIGAGPGGLVVAVGAAKAGKKVALIDKGNWGGDCTNFGCVPSKSLIASARAFHEAHRLKDYGIEGEMDSLHPSGVLRRVKEIVSKVRAEEAPSALAKKGIVALTGEASFLDPHTLAIKSEVSDTYEITARHVVLATGTRARIPEIPGMQQVPYLTNETLFQLEELPAQLVIIGGGPIGVEMGQAFSRLGSRVTLLQQTAHILTREDHEASDVIVQILKQEGVQVLLNSRVKEVCQKHGELCLAVESKEGVHNVAASHVLIAAGRRPNTHSLQLERAGVRRLADDSIEVDAYGRTSQKHIWAVGDVNGWWPFTHTAEYEARTVLTNLLLPWPFRTKLDRDQYVPRVTYTDPELAQVGMLEDDAMKAYGSDRIATYRVDFSKVDRAITNRKTEGFIKLVTKKWSGRVLGATIVGDHAGELISELSLAVRERRTARRIATLIHPYPTLSMVVRKAADGWYKETILPAIQRLWSS